MMNQKHDVSLSFVDVVTNGLGAMLVLFFLVVLLQTQLEWSSAQEQGSSRRKAQQDPFVIIVETKSGEFDPASNPWQFQFPRGEAPQTRGKAFDWGAHHAVVVLSEPPPIGAEIALESQASTVEVVVSYYHGSHKSLRSDRTIVAGQPLEIWPLPADLLPESM